MASADDYLKLVPPEHADKPKYMEMLRWHAQNTADIINFLEQLPSLFDLDTAIGEQLDFVGQWIGRTRYLDIPLNSVYFSFDTPLLGFDQGVWYEPFNQTTALTRLGDEEYRVLLYATIAANYWDGTGPGAYTALQWLVARFGYEVLVQDRPDMQADFALFVPPSTTLTAIMFALFTTGELDLKPLGVRTTHFVQSLPATPYFGFDAQNDHIAGFDSGAWGTQYSTE